MIEAHIPKLSDNEFRKKLKNIRYRLRIQTLDILWNVATLILYAAFELLVCATGSLPLLIVLIFIIAVLITIKFPRPFFQRRLNDFFIVLHYPFSKWHNIFEKPWNRRNRKNQSCESFYHDLSRQMVSMFSYINSEHGYYRTITHEVIVNRLKNYAKAGKLKILTCKPVFQKSLLQNQNSLLYNKCKKCRYLPDCKFRQLSKKPRQFYYIEFYVPKKGGNHNERRRKRIWPIRARSNGCHCSGK